MARRVNTKFLVIFSVIVLGGAAAGFIIAGPFRNYIRGDRSKKMVEQADALVKEADAAESIQTKREKLEQAVVNYRNATVSDTKNPELYLKLGDTLSKLTQFDVGIYIKGMRDSW